MIFSIEHTYYRCLDKVCSLSQLFEWIKNKKEIDKHIFFRIGAWDNGEEIWVCWGNHYDNWDEFEKGLRGLI